MDRNDLTHLEVSLQASFLFLADAIREAGVRYVLWNIERLISAHGLKPYRRLEEKHQFSILSGVPIERLREGSQSTELSLKDREKLVHFLERRWRQVLG